MSNRLTWLHISDIHFLPKNEWRDSESRRALLIHLSQVLSEHPDLRPDLIFCTGDIAFGDVGGSTLSEQYSDAMTFFDSLLAVYKAGDSPMGKDRLFVVPGNHDINRNSINSDAQATLTLRAKDSNRYTLEMNDRFSNKSVEFVDSIKRQAEYSKFVEDYLPHQIDTDGRNIYQRDIKIGAIRVELYGFNSAWTAAGPEDDRNLWLAAISQFNLASRNFHMPNARIGLIHHPTDWLTQADRKVATARVQSDFDFWLHGHTHDAWTTVTGANVTIGAGALGAESSEEFGINITTVDFDTGLGRTHFYTKSISSGGWTIHPIANLAPQGIYEYKLPSRITKCLAKTQLEIGAEFGIVNQEADDQKRVTLITQKLTVKLDYCLRSYTTQPNIWVEPVISIYSETEKRSSVAGQIDLEEILSITSNRIIVAEPQFGLTCLLRHLCLLAWRDFGKLWVYIDLTDVKPNKGAVLQVINAELEYLGASVADLDCIVIDGGADIRTFPKSIRIIADIFPHVVLLCGYDRSGSIDIAPPELMSIRDFSVAYLWTLSRTQIRQVVACYNRENYIGEEDIVTARLSTDLEVLNLHRTPLNCLTLLKVSEFDFDENPVNRSEMIKRILFIIFNIDAIPTYKNRPDLKDCEFVLGFFCQQLIERNTYQFSRSQFISDIQRFCQQQLIDLEIHIVFDVLFSNNIIISVGAQFAFKFSYWILYFSAQRMHHDAAFAAYVLSDIRYAQYPEIIEFYTGIDRKRDDALRLITGDVLAAVEAVKRTCGLPDDMNPYRLNIWKPTNEGVSAMEALVAEGVKESTLPDVIKDQFADTNYDRSRPYDQSLANVLTEYSVASLFKIIQAAARALRNSDYSSPEVKRELLSAIMLAWEQITRVILVILPRLCVERRTSFDGQDFTLVGANSDDPVERARMILTWIPANVVDWFQDDIYSQKMSPLLLERVSNSDASDLSRHELVLLVIRKRPKGWEKIIQQYIANVRKDSYYLLDTYQALRIQYRVGFATRPVLKEIEYLIKMAATKHTTGNKDPGVKAIGKLKFSASVIPERVEPPDAA